jgi:hypothetical protein
MIQNAAVWKSPYPGSGTLAAMAKEAKRFPVAFAAVIRDENFEPLCEVESLVGLRPLH